MCVTVTGFFGHSKLFLYCMPDKAYDWQNIALKYQGFHGVLDRPTKDQFQLYVCDCGLKRQKHYFAHKGLSYQLIHSGVSCAISGKRIHGQNILMCAICYTSLLCSRALGFNLRQGISQLHTLALNPDTCSAHAAQVYKPHLCKRLALLRSVYCTKQ